MLDEKHDAIDKSSPAGDMVLSILDRRKKLGKVRLFLLTDCLTTVVEKPPELLSGLQASFHIWDIKRLFRCVSSGKRREPIDIDFKEMFGESIPCLSMTAGTPITRLFLRSSGARSSRPSTTSSGRGSSGAKRTLLPPGSRQGKQGDSEDDQGAARAVSRLQ